MARKAVSLLLIPATGSGEARVDEGEGGQPVQTGTQRLPTLPNPLCSFVQLCK